MKIPSALMNFIPLMAIPAAFAVPGIGKIFFPYTNWILGALLFTSFLALDWSDLKEAVKRPLKPFYVSILILILSPLIIMPIMGRFFPDFMLGAVIFMLLPVAVASPAVAGIFGGNVAIATINAVSTNLLSPFTIPFFLETFMRTSVEVDIIGMLIKLLLIVFIPFILSVALNRYCPRLIRKAKGYYRGISLGLLFLIFFAAVAPYTHELASNLLNSRLIVSVFISYFILYFFSRLILVCSPDKAERTAITANMLLPNVGMGVVLVQQYFGPQEMLFLIFCQVLWVILISIFKYFR
ncbi:bile acid:sodium symporter [Candidatus Peregrinibacteria bacterium]|nr:bile acid:sodium symporter [Candidatus Peregrinibacteria bacterium]